MTVRITSSHLVLILFVALSACRVRESAAPEADETPAAGGGVGPAAGSMTIPGLPAGQVVLLDVWAPWDEPSRAGQAELDVLAASFGPQGLVVLGWAISDGSERESWPTVRYDRQAVTRELVAQLGAVRALPTRFLVDRKGRVRHTYPGAPLPNDIHEDIAALLAEH